MATASLTTTPTTIDTGASDNVSITNTGAVDVTIVRGSQSFTLRPTQGRVIYPEGAAVTAATVSGTGSVSYTATAARTSQAVQFAADPAFTGTYAQLRLPSYAGARTGPWDPSRSIYNLTPANALKLRSAVAKCGSQRVKIALIGHSELAGSQSGGIGKYDVGVWLRKALAARGYPVGTGVVYAYNNTGLGPDTRYSSVSANWTPMGLGAGSGAFYQCSTASSALTFTSDVAGTVVDVVTFGNSAAFTVNIDAAGAAAITPSGSSALQIVSYTGLANTTHAVVITSVGSTQNYLVGINVRSATGGIEINNSGIGSTLAADWLPTKNASAFYNAYNTAIVGLTPTLVVVQLDANEALTGVSAATYKTNMTTLLTALQTASIPFLLVASPSMVPGGNGFSAVTSTAWNGILSAEYDVADTFGVPLVDLTDRYISQATASAAGIMGDQVHPNGAGYEMNAAAVAHCLSY
jgi:lysophospholipase L1-like esterase